MWTVLSRSLAEKHRKQPVEDRSLFVLGTFVVVVVVLMEELKYIANLRGSWKRREEEPECLRG